MSMTNGEKDSLLGQTILPPELWQFFQKEVAESVEMGVETFRVEWGKPPELEKSYGRWPKSVEDDLWPLEDNHFGASFYITERSLLLDYMKKKYGDMIQFLYHGPFFD